jgi:hypothetical protein
MADYYPLIARAVGGLDKNTGDARRALYERARSALVAQLRGVEPALSESEITRERLALEEAIRKVEAESARHSRADAPRAGAKSADEARARPTTLPRADIGNISSSGEPMFDKPVIGELPEPAASRKAGRGRWFGLPGFGGGGEAKTDREGEDEGAAADEPPAEAPAVKGAREPRPASARFEDRSREARSRDTIFDIRSARPRLPGDAVEEEEVDEAPPRSYAALGKLAAVLALVAALAGLLYWQWDTIGELYQAAVGSRPTTEQARETPPARAKIPDRIGSDTQRPGQAIAPVAQRVVLYEEDPNDPAGKQYVGSAIWRTETVSPGPGLAQELAVRADVEVPDRRITMTWSIRRNTDPNLPASHTVEITFSLPADFAGGGIDKVPGILMKQAEQTRGIPLAGQAVKVTTGFFLIGLSAVEADVQRNVQLLKERAWFDVPVVYNNGRRAILAMEKGTPGDRAFEQAFAAWTRSTIR